MRLAWEELDVGDTKGPQILGDLCGPLLVGGDDDERFGETLGGENIWQPGRGQAFEDGRRAGRQGWTEAGVDHAGREYAAERGGGLAGDPTLFKAR
jgi:hypothetical protein